MTARSRGSWQGLVCTGLFLVSVFLSGSGSFAATGRFFCAGTQQPPFNSAIPVNNTQVLRWKLTTPNQFQARAFVEGRIVQLYPDHSGHTHFAIQIGRGRGEILEVIYSQD